MLVKGNVGAKYMFCYVVQVYLILTLFWYLQMHWIRMRESLSLLCVTESFLEAGFAVSSVFWNHLCGIVLLQGKGSPVGGCDPRAAATRQSHSEAGGHGMSLPVAGKFSPESYLG